MAEKRCVRCGETTPTALGIHLSSEAPTELGDQGFHCARCAAEALAERTGEAFRYLELAPITMTNAVGRRCVFHFQYLTTGPKPCLRAVELEGSEKSGYEVVVAERSDDSSVSLITRLLGKIRRTLARADVEEAPELTVGLRMTSSVIQGVMTYDPKRDGPCVIVDGKEIDWETFGHLLLTYEGFQFRLTFHDLTDEV